MSCIWNWGMCVSAVCNMVQPRYVCMCVCSIILYVCMYRMHVYMYVLCVYVCMSHIMQSHFEAALRVSHISTELTGVMGKRTRFQQKDIAQLILKVSTNNSETPPTSDPAHSPAADAQRFPREVALEDDTILDKINLTEPQNVGHLSLLQQAALLGWW